MEKAVIINHPKPSMNGKTVFVWRASGMRLRWISFSETGKHYPIDKMYLKYEDSAH